MTDPIQLADRRILGMVGLPCDRYSVRPLVHEVQLRDGSLHRLHLVFDAGVHAPYLRAVRLEDGTYAVIHLARISRQLGADLCQCADRDVPGLVHYSLRLVVSDRAAMATAVRAAAVAIAPLQTDVLGAQVVSVETIGAAA